MLRGNFIAYIYVLAANFKQLVMRLFLITLSTIFLFSFRPGEPVATLTCKDKKGVVVFEATIPSAKYLETATLMQNGKSIKYDLEDKSKIVFEPAQKRFFIQIDSATDKEVQLSADSKSFKLIKSEKGPGTQFQKIYSFQGSLKTISSSQPVSLDCKLEYEL